MRSETQDIARTSAAYDRLNGEVDVKGTSLYPAVMSRAIPTSGGGASSIAASAASDSAVVPNSADVATGDEDGDVEEIESTDKAVFTPCF